ncbi:putative phage integrase [Streptococcus parauberis KCTC 11537]|nr:putative phage integrase [Streptococcus parauberis KCTC 11537]
MLSGIIRCGCCNAPMKSLLGMPRKDGTRTRRYQCINRFPRKTKPVTVYNDNKKCDSGYYYMEDVEHAVLHRISTLYSDEIEASEFFEDEITFDIQKVKDEITKIESKINKLNDLYINDFISLDSLKKQSANLINEKKIIENEIEKENSKQVNNLKEDALKILATNNIHDLDYEMQSYVVKSLIDKVFVTKEDMEILFKK